MAGVSMPERGTREREWWLAGATAEASLQTEGMSRDGKEIYTCAQLLAQQGRSREAIVEWLAVVFTADWSLRQRLRLAWRLVRDG